MKGHYLEDVGYISFNEFSPSELAQATGLGADMQRVWRKRGHLPVKSGARASFSCKEVLEIAIRYELSKLGVSPSVTEDAAELGTPTLMLATFFNERGPLEVRGTLEGIGGISSKIERVRTFFEDLTGGVFDQRYLISFKAPVFLLASSIEAEFKKVEHASAIIVDLHALANMLVRASPKPFVTVRPG